MSSSPPSRPVIRALPKEVVDRIAAGEVVQRPASIVKELIENSLDANSKCIEIGTCSSGGMHLLSISDDGDGINPSDLPLAAVRFATSKLCQFDDLKSISTFGFRGEALASASMVSRLSICSRCRYFRRSQDPNSNAFSESCAYKQSFRDGKPSTAKPSPTAGNMGTTVRVEDLFYNVPSRKRAFAGAKKETEEFNKILHIAQRYAIHKASNGISFVCKRKKRKGGGTECDLNTQSLVSIKRVRDYIANKKDQNNEAASNEKTEEERKFRENACKEAIGHIFGSGVASELLPLYCGEGDVEAVSLAALQSLLRHDKQEAAHNLATMINLAPSQTQNDEVKASFPSNLGEGLSMENLIQPSSSTNATSKLEFAYRAFGLLTNGSYCAPKSSASFILMINDRLVECASIKRAVEGVYGDTLPRGGKPFVYLSLTLPGPHVDVNVHPTKREVALLYEDELCERLATMTRELLGSATASRKFYVQALLPTQTTAASHNSKSKEQGGGEDGGRLKRRGTTARMSQNSSVDVATCSTAASLLEKEEGAKPSRESMENKDTVMTDQTSSTLSPSKKKREASSFSQTSRKKAYDPKNLVRTSTAAPAGALEPFLVQTQSPTKRSKNQVYKNSNGTDANRNIYSFSHKENCEFYVPPNGSSSSTNSTTVDMTIPGAFTTICRCQIERGGKDLLANVTTNNTTTIRPKKVIPTECSYSSIQTLRQDIHNRSHSDLASKLRNATFVGVISRHRSLIQWGMELLMLQHYELARELFYQLALNRFGLGGVDDINGKNRAKFKEGMDVKVLIEHALQLEEHTATTGNSKTTDGMVLEEEQENSYENNFDDTNKELAQQATTCLVDHMDMLNEYFGISFEIQTHEANKLNQNSTSGVKDSSLILIGLPILLDGHAPSPHALPLFLLRLATEVNWTEERACFEGICTELGSFYADLPFEQEEEEAQNDDAAMVDVKSQLKPTPKKIDSTVEKMVKHTLFPAISFLLVPPKEFASDGTVVKLALLSSLYKVFERC